MCLQAETDMITTDEDVKMEANVCSIQSLVSLLFKFCHAMPLLVYTLIAVIILRYPRYSIAIDILRDSTGTVIYLYALTASGLGPKLA